MQREGGRTQTRRNEAIAELAKQIDLGIRPPIGYDRASRLLFPDKSGAASERVANTCLVCSIPLLGKQRDFCSGHWDVIVIDRDLLADRSRLITFLEETLAGLFVDVTRRYWQATVHGMTRCEVCNHLEGVLESLKSHGGETIKSHLVCGDHASFRKPA